MLMYLKEIQLYKIKENIIVFFFYELIVIMENVRIIIGDNMKKRKGFTLIELLAVIVILGLLMAIAIPSVTKYITESRKKTLTTTLGNYIGALVNEVNDLSYTFTGTNTIYAVPIECIALERGGTNPFGHWYQANDAYFAYVLIQYDDVNSKYVYGFTFKDSAGYGLYPTIQANINEKGKQVKTGYDLNKPETGNLTSLASIAKWQESGFKVDSSTYLQVLEATSENEVGNGTTTCTLQQKGDNYAQVEEDKNNNKYSDNLPAVSSPIYFGYKYNILVYESGQYITKGYTFYENGSVDVYINDIYEEKLPSGTMTYSSTQVLKNDVAIYNIADNKRTLNFIDGNGKLKVQDPTIDCFYYGRNYVGYEDGMKYTYTVFADGSAILYQNGVLSYEFPKDYFQYNNVAAFMFGKVIASVSDDKKTFVILDEETTGLKGSWVLEE